MKNFFLFLILTSFVFAEEIKLPEEKIFGESKKIVKTEIIIFYPEISKIKFPEIKTSKIEIEKIKREKEKKNTIYLARGSFYTTDFYFSHREQNLFYKIYNHYTDGFRENDSKYFSGITFKQKKEKYALFLNLEKTKEELPGPLSFPFYTARTGLNLTGGVNLYLDKKTTLSLFQNYYKIDELKNLFSSLKIKKEFNPFLSEITFRRQDFFHNFSENSFSTGIYFKREKIKGGGKIKIIESYGTRFIPYFLYPFSTNLNFEINGSYRIPDLWKDVIGENWTEIKKTSLKPEEGYWIALNYNRKEENYKINSGTRYAWFKSLYTWSDIDKNFLFEPFSENFNQISFYLNYSKNFNSHLKYFLNFEKSIRSKDIEYLPENIVNSGFTFTYLPLIFRLWGQYNGKRISNGKEMGSFVLINCDIKYKKKKWEAGIKIENIGNKKFFEVEGYPSERREIKGYFKLYF